MLMEGGWRVWMLMAEAAHMLTCFLLWRFVKEKPQTLQVYMAEQTLVKHKQGLVTLLMVVRVLKDYWDHLSVYNICRLMVQC